MPTQSENETVSSNTVAMWTAISNPLLLISQVLRKSEGHFSVKGSPSNENACYSDITCLSRCACQETRRRVLESLSLSKIPIGQTYDNVSINPKNKSFSVQGALNDKTICADPFRNSRSDSSFNPESNVSEEKMFPSDCYKYRSLESVDSSHTDCNSIQVNFDEGSTFNSPKEEEMNNTEVKSNLYYQVSNQQTRNIVTHTNHGGSNCWSSETLNGNADSVHLSHTPSVTSISSKSSPSRKRKKFHSSRQRRRKSKSKSNDSSSLNSVTQCSISNPDIARRKLSLNKTVKHDLTGHWSILPIFKQLIVQKHQGSGTVDAMSVDEARQMSSCPNLLIKWDVVEYFYLLLYMYIF